MTNRRQFIAGLAGTPLAGSTRAAAAAGAGATAPAHATAAAHAAPPTPAPDPETAARLRALIDASDAAALRLDPMPRVAPDWSTGTPAFVDPLAESTRAAIEARARQDLAELASIDPARLGPVDRIARDAFEYRARREHSRFSEGHDRQLYLAPLNASFGLHVELADYVAGAGAPFNTLADYEAGRARLAGFAGYLRSLERALRDGLAAGVVQSQIVARQVAAQSAAMLATPAGTTPFHSALRRFPDAFDAPMRERLRRAYETTIERELLPAYARLREVLERDYLPRATASPGRWAMREGAALYAWELDGHATLPSNAEAIHALGRREVARIRGEMETMRREVGFAGDLQALFAHVRTDPQFYFTKPEDLIARMRDIEQRIWNGMPRLFARRPRAPFAVRALPALGAQRGTGYYRPGPPDGVSPGILWFNMSMLGTRPIPTLETLTMHEGIPGHHYQITLVLEDASLPPILRFGGLTAYSEGWGLYAESLGRELGLFTDPWQGFGHLDMEMLRAVRLVVDTGLHAKRWERQQAIDYMLANTSMARHDVEVEIDRYISAPGQACAYKIGELEIAALRERARVALSGRFDVRAFHEQVLATGALPLSVLRNKIGRWSAVPA